MKEGAKKGRGRAFSRLLSFPHLRIYSIRLRVARLGWFSALLRRLVWGARHDVYRLRVRDPACGVEDDAGTAGGQERV